jgi:hypothetical protein
MGIRGWLRWRMLGSTWPGRRLWLRIEVRDGT